MARPATRRDDEDQSEKWGLGEVAEEEIEALKTSVDSGEEDEDEEPESTDDEEEDGGDNDEEDGGVEDEDEEVPESTDDDELNVVGAPVILHAGLGRPASKRTEEEEDEEYLQEKEDALASSGGTHLLAQPSCINGQMQDYQLAGLNWLIRLYENDINGILADEMGLEAAPQIISLMGYLQSRGITGPHMVVAPKSTLDGWMNKIAQFCPLLRVKHIKKKLLVPGMFDVCLTSFDMAIKEKKALKRFSWRYIIIDEAHRIKNENAVLSQTMRLFRSNYRLLITSTPVQNNPHELWSLLNFLMPKIFSSAETFHELFQIIGENVSPEVRKVVDAVLLRRRTDQIF
ncbi:putative chromatin-remodeling complex ATPase chain [Hordeum vulgare]|nr:putative chromatin-remodeling complex ATPase chain [Hordeum vulgare]